MKKKNLSICIVITLICIVTGITLGSVNLPLSEIGHILGHKLFGIPLPDSISPIRESILWTIRLPRVLTAFSVGALLSISGAVMQAVLQNPLASSYTLGVSSGASLGAAAVITAGVSIPFLLPVCSFATGMLSVIIALLVAARIDPSSRNTTIILIGMIFSLFASAVLTLIESTHHESLSRLVMWLMGSFASRGWPYAAILLPSAFIALFITMFFWRELDILTFGEEQSLAMGVDVKKTKWALLTLATAYTALAVCFTGVIGFVDLVVPHAVRRIYGARHKQLLPLATLYGGAFMVLADLISRTVISPREIPIGAMTALIGAPCFAYIYFKRREQPWK